MDKERLELTYEIVNYETKHNLIKEKEEIDKKITNLKSYLLNMMIFILKN